MIRYSVYNEDIFESEKKSTQQFKYPKLLFVIAVISLSILASIMCIKTNNQLSSAYKYLFLLPLCHAFSFTLLFGRSLSSNLYTSLPVLIIASTLTVRNVITPLIMAIQGSASVVRIQSFSSATLAIALLSFETICVFITMHRFGTRKKNSKKAASKGFKCIKGSFTLVFLFALGVSLMSLILLPELRTQYYTIFTNDITHLVQSEINYPSGIKRLLGSGGELLIEASRIVLFSWIIYQIRKKLNNIFGYVLCLLMVLVQFFFMTDSNAYIIMLAFVLFLLIYKLYPQYRRSSMFLLIIIVALFGTLLYINRFSLDHYGTSLPRFLQAYFPGVANTAGIVGLKEGRTAFDAVRQILIDLYAAVPFRSTLFGYDGGLIDLPSLWNKENGVSGQILSTIGQSYYYFGFVFSPILSVVLTTISIKIFSFANRINNPLLFSVLMYLSLYSAVAISMYDPYIFVSNLLTRIAFGLLLALFYEKTFDDLQQLSK